MERYLIDTNVISDYFTCSFSAAGMQFMDAATDAIPNLSIITQIELLCWRTDPSTEQRVKDLIGDSFIFDITPEVVIQCVNIRKGKKILLRDIPPSPKTQYAPLTKTHSPAPAPGYRPGEG